MSLNCLFVSTDGKGTERFNGGKVFLPSTVQNAQNDSPVHIRLPFVSTRYIFWLNLFIFEERFSISVQGWGFWDKDPYCPWSSGLSGGTGPEDHWQCAMFYLFFFFLWFCLLIDLLFRHLVRYQKGSKVGANVRERKVNEKLKYIK